jgi:N-acetylneuraminic acid mutarotase
MHNNKSRLAAGAAFAVWALQLVSPAWAQWTSIAPLPTIRQEPMAAAVGANIYVIGGAQGGCFETTGRVDALNTLTGAWSARAPLPTPRLGGVAVAVAGKIYVIGGSAFCSSFLGGAVEVYDPATNHWTARAPMPGDRVAHAAAALDGKIYVMGGRGPDDLEATLLIYDTITDGWTTGASMPQPRAGFGAVALNGLIYAVGAIFGDSLVIAYDPATDTWTSRPGALPHNPFSHQVVVLDGAIHVLGGSQSSPSFQVLSRMDRYDESTGTWIAKPSMLSKRRGFAAVVLGESIYAVGGFDGAVVIAAAEVFNAPPPPTDTTAPQVVASATPAANAAGWNNGNVNVALSATDDAGGSGVASVTYNLTGASGGGATVPGAATSVGVTAEGVSTVTYRAADVAGNTSTDQTLVVRIDKTAPQAIASAMPAANAAGWNNTNVNVALAATDSAGSGVASLTYTVVNGASSGGATVPGSTASFEVTGEGVNTVTYRASDVASNDNAPQTFVVRIDRTGPAGTLTVSPSVLWPPNSKMVAVHVSLAASDASGPVSVAGPVITSNETPSAAGDWEVSGTTLRLRAARNDDGDGRIYTLAYTLTDAAGNTSELTAIVTVPHDRGR